MKEVLKVQLLGGFSMYYGDRSILLNKMESSKASRLLQMLLAAAPDGIAKNELIDNLYGWDENSDAVNRKRSLNNVIYRLKSVLSAAGLPGESFVETIDGVCRFAPGIPLETDAAQFAELVARADAAVTDCSYGGVMDALSRPSLLIPPRRRRSFCMRRRTVPMSASFCR